MEVSAAADQDYFPMHQNNNGHFTDYDLNTIDNYFDSENNYIFAYFSGYAGGYGTRMKNFYIIVIPKNAEYMIYGEKFTNLYQFNIYTVGGTIPSNQIHFFQILDQGWQYDYGSNLGSFQNLYSSNYNSDVDYVSNFRLYTDNTSAHKLVLNYTESPIYNDPDNDTYPSNFDKPNIDDYYNTDDAPQFDNTDLPSAVESLYNILKWFFGQGLPGIINFVIDNTNWALQKVINNIREVIEDFVEIVDGHLSDIKDWIDDIKDGLDTLVDFVINPWDSSEFQTDLNSSTFYTSLNGTVSNIRSFGTSLTRASEPENLSFTINLTSIGWGTSEIDFNWIKPFRTVIRLIIGCVLVYWLVITVITSINNIVSSGSDNEE